MGQKITGRRVERAWEKLYNEWFLNPLKHVQARTANDIFKCGTHKHVFDCKQDDYNVDDDFSEYSYSPKPSTTLPLRNLFIVDDMGVRAGKCVCVCGKFVYLPGCLLEEYEKFTHSKASSRTQTTFQQWQLQQTNNNNNTNILQWPTSKTFIRFHWEMCFSYEYFKYFISIFVVVFFSPLD